MAISNNCFSGKDLSNKNQFLEDSKKEIESLITKLNCSFFCGKRFMTFSMEIGFYTTEDQVRKILKIIEGNFAKIKKLCLIGWCTLYMIVLVELYYLSISPNRRFYQSNKTEFIPFNLCYCFNCRCLTEDGPSQI